MVTTSSAHESLVANNHPEQLVKPVFVLRSRSTERLQDVPLEEVDTSTMLSVATNRSVSSRQ